jgi:hypothetical protein
MNTKPVKSIASSIERDRHLFLQIPSLLEVDLSNPKTEMTARKVLNKLRQKGYPILSFDLEEVTCTSCLYLALQSAADLMWIPNHFHQ